VNNVIFASICKTPNYRASGIVRNKYIANLQKRKSPYLDK